ncbi:hypothetical protein CBR_g31186 [Chara braunii]|uniref:Reverse transcriptase domain-containing protein n=1 Tax=Chara braunii TaxID=69332 RepID=A0A388JXQ4_CHABU|nr:hypothetical protein CBR_g31186 [Chara braunii]|eukprot:GBG62547.1 hypothetical protein CBR_g31186 [Chara braunii]
MEQDNRQARPEANEVPMSEEDRIRLLIAKCYEDGVFPENLRHGEFVIENGTRIFKVNTQIDKLTTTWLKERTVTVIFQGEARDLPMRTREDLIRAYENGWQRKKTFARGFKRGRVHGEGPNVMSYVAKSREVAQWLVAKVDDVVIIRGVEYKMLFKAWMTRAELEEQRRRDVETKFWVVALRVPLRAMFHVGDLVTQAMGQIITRHPREPDATRPKLMSLKFELAREAAEKFEAILPMKLDDGELYNVQFVNKNTSWCTRCKWWFHTDFDGCPRAEEAVPGEQETLGGRSRRPHQGEVVYDRGIRTAVRDQLNVTPSGGESSAAAERRLGGPMQPAYRQGDRTAAPTSDISIRPQGLVQGVGDPYQLATADQVRRLDARVGAWASNPGASDPYLAAMMGSHMWLQPQGGGARYGQWTNPALSGFQGGNQYYSPGPSLGQRYDHSTFSRPVQEALRPLSGAVEIVVGVDGEGQERNQLITVNGHGATSVQERSAAPHSEGEDDVSKPNSIPNGVSTRDVGEQQFEEKVLLPLICTLLGQEPYILGLVNREGGTVLPSTSFCGIPTPELIEARVRQIFADRFCFRIFLGEIMPKLTVDTPTGKRIKFFIPLIDARIPMQHWAGLPSVGLTCIPLRLLLGTPGDELDSVLVEPGISAAFLRALNEHMPLNRNLLSEFIPEVLAEIWQSISPSQEREGTEQTEQGRIQDGNATQTVAVQSFNAGMSDHKAVRLEARLSRHTDARGPGYFRLNTVNLEDEGWKDWTTQHWRAWRMARGAFDSFEDWCDAGLRIISAKFETFSVIAAYSRNKEESRLEARVDEAERNMRGHPISELAWAEERETRAREWEQQQVIKQSRWESILQEKGVVTRDRMTKECFQRLLPSCNRVQMSELQHPHLLGLPAAHTNEDMCEYAADYFRDITTTRKTYWDWETDLTMESNFWETLTVRVSAQERRDMDRPITAEELRETIKSMAKGKAPGDDGLPVEFFQTCWGTLETDVVQLFNGILTGGKLGKSMTRGVITLMYKKGGRSDMRNWRPISLLNVIYKILAKTLARRLGELLPRLVGKDQGAFVQGRSIFENIATAMEALELIEGEDLDIAVLMIDLEKAYDRLNWTFVMTTLRVLGFGDPLCSWIKALYAYATTVVQVNGVCSQEFKLSRSLRQGCPLAPLVRPAVGSTAVRHQSQPVYQRSETDRGKGL